VFFHKTLINNNSLQLSANQVQTAEYNNQANRLLALSAAAGSFPLPCKPDNKSELNLANDPASEPK
jgi:hypothetical protein